MTRFSQGGTVVSGLRAIDIKVVDSLVDCINGPGYVLDFTDRTFSEFFAVELDIDIDEPRYAEFGGSKGKRFRRFLQLVDDKTAVRTLKALWEYRKTFFDLTGRADPVANAEGKYLNLLNTLGSGPASPPQEPPKPAFNIQKIGELKAEVVRLTGLEPQARGYAFEKFLYSLFEFYGMRPRESFRNRGEQIDGSFVLSGETYLLEAKWQSQQIGAHDLDAFEGRLSQKATWARGLFISHSGFTEDGLYAFGRGKRTICMTGLDIFEMLDRSIPLDHVIDRKARRAAEDGIPHTAVRHLF